MHEGEAAGERDDHPHVPRRPGEGATGRGHSEDLPGGDHPAAGGPANGGDAPGVGEEELDEAEADGTHHATPRDGQCL